MNANRTASTQFSKTRILRVIERFPVYFLVIAGAILTAMPFVWMFLTSFKGTAEVARIPLRWLPIEWRFSNYAEIWNVVPFTRFYLNSVLVAVCQTIGILVTSSMGAYAFARIKFWGRDVIFLLYLGTLMIPEWVTLIPLYLIIKQFGWLNHYEGLIIPGLTSAIGTFLLRQFFLSIPQEYEDAAYIDGANHFQIFSQIVLPLAKPAVLTVGLISFMGSWNSFLWPLLIMSNVDMQTLPLGLAHLALTQGAAWLRVDWGPLMAATLLSILPILIIYIFLQNYFIRGIALSGLK